MKTDDEKAEEMVEAFKPLAELAKLIPDESSEIILAKAIFAAGFRCGHKYGSDAATAFEWGTHSREPQTPEAAWAQDVQWAIDTDTTSHVDITNPSDWNSIP